jgi:S-methylmethionine-dependent homocysteine/selenocysteine methylase
VIAAQFVYGSIPTWALFFLALVVAWRVTRGGAGSAVSELSKANEVLTQRVHDLGAEVRDLKVENERLKARTDVSLVIAPEAQRIIDETRAALAEHERTATEWHQQQLASGAKQLIVLDLIAGRLGPDPNGDGERKAA